MLLGPAPAGFMFQPKHKAKSAAQSDQSMALGTDDGAENG